MILQVRLVLFRNGKINETLGVLALFINWETRAAITPVFEPRT